MRTSSFATLWILFAAPALLAQDAPPGPAPQLQKFAPLIGTWEGAGTVRQSPDGPESKWTATGSVGWTLGGHFVRENIRIDIEGMEQPLVFVDLYGWDTENQRHVMTEAGNLGTVALIEVRFGDDGTMMTAQAGVAHGQLVAERWLHRVAGDTWKFQGEQSIDDGAFFRHVAGVMTRVSEKPAEVDLPDAPFMPELAAMSRPHIERILPVTGSYRMKGWFKLGPDMPQTELSGDEAIMPAFGGTMLEFRSKGDPIPGIGEYEALGWMAWNDHERCYSMVFVNSFGQIGEQQCRLSGERAMVVTHAGLNMGQPSVSRGVIELDAQGAFSHYAGHMLIGTQPPTLFFEATYEKQ